MSASVPPLRIPPGFLVGFCNPLLDITCLVNEEFLKRYRLQPNDSISLNAQSAINNELTGLRQYGRTPGGSSQNVLRVAQWILAAQPQRFDATGATVHFGGVGADLNARRLQMAAAACGLRTVHETHPEHRTGVCWVLISGTNRVVCADLDASRHLSLAHIDLDENRTVIKAAGVLVVSGFFLASNATLTMRLAEQAYGAKQTFVFNMSAERVVVDHLDDLMRLIPYVDILIGNYAEYQTLAGSGVNGLEPNDDCCEIARQVVKLPKMTDSHEGAETMPTDGRIVVVTQGADEVIVAKRGWLGRFAVPALRLDQIVDTNGSGDAFEGGFLAEYVAARVSQTEPTIDMCVRCGVWAAQQMIGVRGVTVGGPVTYFNCPNNEQVSE